MFQRLKDKVKGFRTFIGAGAIGAVGSLSLLGQFDLTPVVQLFVKDQAALPLAMLAIAIFFGYMRYITNTSPGGMLSVNQTAPVYKGVDDGV